MNVRVLAVDGIGEVVEGDDLARKVTDASQLRDGDIVVVTSKVVSKAEGRVVRGDKDAAVTQETDREVARRGPTRIVRNRLGLTMAGAGVDASNVELGALVLLPHDPDASARALREAIAPNVAVVVSDTIGRAWRHGQTDHAIGAAGLDVLHDYAGLLDPYGNELAVTAPSVADEIAGAGDLVKRKLAGCPVAVVRGLAELVLPRGQHGPGAASLVREEATDMFGYGAREAVLHALLQDGSRGFGDAAPAEVLVEALATLGIAASARGRIVVAPSHPAVAPAAWAHSWVVVAQTGKETRLAPRQP